jgi:hypothetical protein
MGLEKIRTPIDMRKSLRPPYTVELRTEISIVEREEGQPDKVISETTDVGYFAPTAPEVVDHEASAVVNATQEAHRAGAAEHSATARADQAEAISAELMRTNAGLKAALQELTATANAAVGERDATISALRQKIATIQESVPDAQKDATKRTDAVDEENETLSNELVAAKIADLRQEIAAMQESAAPSAPAPATDAFLTPEADTAQEDRP